MREIFFIESGPGDGWYEERLGKYVETQTEARLIAKSDSHCPPRPISGREASFYFTAWTSHLHRLLIDPGAVCWASELICMHCHGPYTAAGSPTMANEQSTSLDVYGFTDINQTHRVETKHGFGTKPEN